jgi:hypothetical protein
MLSEPWFRTSDGWWYAYVRENGGRRQIRLVKGEDRRDEAWDRWTELRQSLKRTGTRHWRPQVASLYRTEAGHGIADRVCGVPNLIHSRTCTFVPVPTLRFAAFVFK